MTKSEKAPFFFSFIKAHACFVSPWQFSFALCLPLFIRMSLFLPSCLPQSPGIFPSWFFLPPWPLPHAPHPRGLPRRLRSSSPAGLSVSVQCKGQIEWNSQARETKRKETLEQTDRVAVRSPVSHPRCTSAQLSLSQWLGPWG